MLTLIPWMAWRNHMKGLLSMLESATQRQATALYQIHEKIGMAYIMVISNTIYSQYNTMEIRDIQRIKDFNLEKNGLGWSDWYALILVFKNQFMFIVLTYILVKFHYNNAIQYHSVFEDRTPYQI